MSGPETENWLQKDSRNNSQQNVVRAFGRHSACVCLSVCVGFTGDLNENEKCSIIHKAVCTALLQKYVLYESLHTWWRCIFPHRRRFYRFDKSQILHLGFMPGCVIYSLNSENTEKALREYIKAFFLLFIILSCWFEIYDFTPHYGFLYIMEQNELPHNYEAFFQACKGDTFLPCWPTFSYWNKNLSFFYFSQGWRGWNDIKI